MNRLFLPAGIAALVLAALVSAACAGASPQEATRTRAPTPTPSSTSRPAAPGPPQVEAGAPVGDPAGELPRPEAEVVRRGPDDVRAVALTFDTGTPAGHVPEILDVLKEHGKVATFGITGQWAVTNPALLKRLVEEGHAVINHSWSHASFTGEDTGTEPLSAEQIRDELKRTEEKIQEIAGVSSKPYFRPPYGDYDGVVNQLLREEGYEYNVLWTLDSEGWQGRPTKSIVSATLANAVNGAIFLYHTDNGRDYAALAEIIEGLNERGLEMVTIPQLLGKAPMPTPTATPSPGPTEVPPPPVPPLVAASEPAPPPPPPLAAASEPTPPPPPPPGPAPVPIPTPTPNPTPTPVPYVTAAYDDFESGGTGGGQGWTGPWSSLSFAVGEGQAPSGSRYLDMAASGAAQRWADLGAQGELHLRFWARFYSVEAEDRASVHLSDGATWAAYSLFSADKNDNVWRLYDIALPFPATTELLLLRFDAQMDPQDDLWHIDDVEVAVLPP